MNSTSRFLVFGATGRTGRHFVALALKEGHTVRALARNPENVAIQDPRLELHKGSILDYDDLDSLLNGVDFVVAMLGNAKLQSAHKVNNIFIRKLIPAMRRQGVRRFLYQAGGLTRKYKEPLPIGVWILRNTIARYGGLIGQHDDNGAVIEYLVEECGDIDWIVHRAAIISDGASKGVLKRSGTRSSLATFGDCATYNYQVLMDDSAIHTYDLSFYG